MGLLLFIEASFVLPIVKKRPPKFCLYCNFPEIDLCCAVYEKSQCTFSAESPGWGHQKMALIAAVNDPTGGFVIDDTIYIGISKTET